MTGEKRYTRSNPPPNEAAANARIEMLETGVSQIETALEFKGVEDFDSKEELESWRSRATGALGFMRAELKLLGQWIGDERGGKRLSAKEVKDLAHSLAAEIGREYTPRYSFERPPATITEAKERMDHLSSLKHRLQAAFSQVTEAWTAGGYGRKELQSVKSPLQQILSEIEVEIGAIKAALRQTPNRSDWKAILVGAISRAVDSGFELTADEEEVLEAYRQHLKN
jgi:hypothetical protein